MKKYLLLTALTFSLFTLLSQVPNYVPTSGLVGWWPFNGNAIDASGNGNNGTVNGATLTTDRFGVASKAYNFDGNDWIEVLYNSGFNFGTQSFTLSCWSLKIGANQWQHLITRNYIPTFPTRVNNYALRYENNTLVLFSGSNATASNGVLQSSTLVGLSSWNHFVGVYNASIQKMQIYLNGVMISESTINSSPQNYNSIGNMYFGAEHPSFPLPNGPQFLTGKIDDIGIWNRALSQCEILQLYNSSVPTVSAGSDQTVCSGTPVTLAGSGATSYTWNNAITDNTPFIPTTSATYTVTGTDANTCTATDQVVVQVTELPTVTESINDICPGEPVTLTASSPLSNKTPCASEDLPLSLQSGLVGYWPFCGNANDESGNGNNGTVNGATLTTDRFGNANNAYSFDGVNDFIVTPRNHMPQFSVSTWVKLNSTSCFSSIIDAYSSSWEFLTDCASGTNLSLAIWTGATYQIYQSNYNLSSGMWIQVVCTFDSGNICKIYANGNLVSTQTTVNLTAANGNFYFGRSRSGSDSYLNGSIDDIAIYNRALTAAEITALYNIGNPTYSWSTGSTTSSITVNPGATTTYTCDVTVNGQTCSDELTINVIPNSSSTISLTVCNTYTAPDAAVYTTSGTYTAVIPNTAGCDSTITINLTVNNSTSSTISPTVCDTYTAPDGAVYTTSGTHTAVIPNAAGCDSTITINLTVNNSTSSTISSTVCDTYTAPDGTVYTTSGTHTAVIPNAIGCDSTITINLTVKQSTSSTISPTVCDTYTAPDGTIYTSSGTYTAVIPNAAGCDSTITINLTVNNATSSTITPTVCDTYTAPDGTLYTSSGTYTVVIPNAADCDSTITINLTVNNATSSTISQTVCDTYTAPDGAVYTASGIHTAVIPNAAGCDSTITVNLTVYDSPTLNAGSDQLVCEGTEVTLTASGAATYSWTNGIVNGTPFTPAVGTLNYNVTGTDANGCQGSDNVLVTVTTSPILTLTSSSPECPGEATGTAEAVATGGTIPYTFLWNNGSVSPLNNEIPAGTYSVILTDNAGCSESGIVVVTDASEPCFFIPGGLSPNADGSNDSWAVSGLSAYPDAKVMVYNRWGQLLYDAGPDDAPWDGTYLGDELPTADYYYIIDLGNGETFNGVITLKR